MRAYLCCTRGSGVLASACDVLEMSLVRGVGRVCDMCMCLARGGRCYEWVTKLGFLEEHGESGICAFGCGGIRGVGGRLGPGRAG